MIRKHFRIRRIVIGLAFAAITAPAAQAYSGLTTDGPTRGVQSASTQTSIRSEISVQPTALTQAQVEALRYQAMVDRYAQLSPVRSENSFGAPGPSAGGATGPTGVETVATTSSSFDWSDAGIGGSVIFGAMLMVLLTAVTLGRRHRSVASV
jgi:hypothetical protein